MKQPVMIQSFKDEFDLDEHGKDPRTPTEAGKILSKRENKAQVLREKQKFYHKGVGKLLHMMNWT